MKRSAGILLCVDERGVSVDADLIYLGAVKQAGGKLVSAWALERDFDAAGMQSKHV